MLALAGDAGMFAALGAERGIGRGGAIARDQIDLAAAAQLQFVAQLHQQGEQTAVHHRRFARAPVAQAMVQLGQPLGQESPVPREQRIDGFVIVDVANGEAPFRADRHRRKRKRKRRTADQRAAQHRASGHYHRFRHRAGHKPLFQSFVWLAYYVGD
ncbi:hypothetical protein D9M73_137920 [compost metagenome]